LYQTDSPQYRARSRYTVSEHYVIQFSPQDKLPQQVHGKLDCTSDFNAGH